MAEWSNELIEETIRVFKPNADRLGEEFTREDAVESINNMVALFDLLIEIDRRLIKEEMPKLLRVIKALQIKKNKYEYC